MRKAKDAARGKTCLLGRSTQVAAGGRDAQEVDAACREAVEIRNADLAADSSWGPAAL